MRAVERGSGPTSLRPVAAAFVVFGVFNGVWAVGALDVQRSFDLTDAQLGLLLAVGILGATAIAAFGGALSDRWGAGRSLALALVTWGGLVALGAGSQQLALFVVVYTLAMAAGGFVDVVMNIIAADALAHEPGGLVRFHGLFNAGAAAGAVVLGVVVRAGASWRYAWLVVAIAGIVTGLVARRSRVPEPPPSEHLSMLRAITNLRHEGLVVLATVFAVSAAVEGGIATWAIIYLRDDAGLGVVAGVGAYVVGQVLATFARFGSRPIVARLGHRRAIALGAGLAAGGLTLEVTTHVAALAALGIALAAVGVSVVWPLLLAVVNNEAQHPAVAIGGVTACGYLGMVAGPPIVGVVAGAFGLRAGLLVLAGAALFVAVTPAHVRKSLRATS